MHIFSGLILTLAIFTTTSAVASNSVCVQKIEGIARQISQAAGMESSLTIGLAHDTEIQGSQVTVYIGARASFDHYAVTVRDWEACSLAKIEITTAQ